MTSHRHISARGVSRRAARCVAAVAGLVWASTAVAQAPVHRFAVTTRAGGINFERAASLNRSFLIGADAEYGLSKYFALGTAINVARPNTHAEDFTRLISYGLPASGGDTTYFYKVGQAVNLVEAAFTGTARAPLGRLSPYVTGGAGIYGAFLDAQKNNGPRRFGGLSTQLGGGVAYAFSNRAGVQLDVRDVMLHQYRQNRLDPSHGRNVNTIFPDFAATPPAPKNMVNSIGYSIGFRYVPVFLNAGTGDPDDRILNPNGGAQ